MLCQILKDALKEAGIPLYPVKFPIIIRNGVNSKGKKVHYIFNYSSEDYFIDNPFPDSLDIISEKPYFSGDKIEIADWDFVILEEQ